MPIQRTLESTRAAGISGQAVTRKRTLWRFSKVDFMERCMRAELSYHKTQEKWKRITDWATSTTFDLAIVLGSACRTSNSCQS